MMETYRKEDIRRGDIYYSRLLGIDSIDEYIRYGGLYPDELKRLQKDYADLWGPLSDLLKQLSALVEL